MLFNNDSELQNNVTTLLKTSLSSPECSQNDSDERPTSEPVTAKKFYSKFYKYKTTSKSSSVKLMTSINHQENGIMDNEQTSIRPTTSSSIPDLSAGNQQDDIFESFDFAKFFYNPSPSSTISSNPMSPDECNPSSSTSPSADYYDLQKFSNKSNEEVIEENLFRKNLLLSPASVSSATTSDSEIENKKFWCNDSTKTTCEKKNIFVDDDNIDNLSSNNEQTSSEVKLVTESVSDNDENNEKPEEENFMVLVPSSKCIY